MLKNSISKKKDTWNPNIWRSEGKRLGQVRCKNIARDISLAEDQFLHFSFRIILEINIKKASGIDPYQIIEPDGILYSGISDKKRESCEEGHVSKVGVQCPWNEHFISWPTAVRQHLIHTLIVSGVRPLFLPEMEDGSIDSHGYH